MEDAISQAKADYLRSKEYMVKALAATPDDRINWSPASTARTPVELVGHSAIVTDRIRQMIMGTPLSFTTTAEIDARLREEDKAFTTREKALELLEKNSAAYLAWLDTLTPELMASSPELIFGPVPMTFAITLPAAHLRHHAAQLDYIQTIYGDRDWR